jgi:membrane protease YdiL (CAAX protease family)
MSTLTVRRWYLPGITSVIGFPVAWMAFSQGALACGVSLNTPDVWTLAVLLLLAPAVEETVLRCGLQDGLRWLFAGHRAAGVIEVSVAAVAFVAMHLGRTPWPATLAWVVPGLVLAVIYFQSRHAVQSILVHASFNLAALIACFQG